MTFTYDIRGNVTNITNNVSEIELTYQHFDRGDVIASARSSGRGSRTDLPDTTINYQYNEVGEKIGASTPVGHFTYTRDAAGRLRHLTNHKGEVFDINYDLNSRVKNIAGPAVYTSFTYDTIGFNSVINHTRKSSGATIERFIYGRDLVGNRTTKQTLAGTAQYSYDDNYQLTQSIVPTLPTENFAYDSVGNQTNGGQVYDDSKQELQEDANYIYAYDELGNLVSKQEKAFTGNVQNYEFDSENKMHVFKLYKDGNLVTEAHYVYDALGRRIEKEVIDHEQNATSVKRFVYDENEILAEMNENNEVNASYTHSTLRTDDVLAVSTGGNSYFMIKDSLGSITDVTDSGGFKIQHIDYSAFGKLLKITNASGVDITNNPIVKMPFTFTGREYDSESNLYYYRARYYDPQAGRFLQADPLAGIMNSPITFNSKYSYVLNNPVNNTDPTGEFSISNRQKAVLSGAIIGGLAVGPLGAVAGALLGNKYYKQINQFVRDHATEIKIAAIIALSIGTGGTAGALIAAGGLIGGIHAANTDGDIGDGVLRGGLIALGGAAGATLGASAVTYFGIGAGIEASAIVITAGAIGSGTAAGIYEKSKGGTSKDIKHEAIKGTATGIIEGTVLPTGSSGPAQSSGSTGGTVYRVGG